MDQKNLNLLPREILLRILSYCSDQDVLLRISHVSRTLYALSHDAQLFSGFFRREWLSLFHATKPTYIKDAVQVSSRLTNPAVDTRQRRYQEELGDHRVETTDVIAYLDRQSLLSNDKCKFWARWSRCLAKLASEEIDPAVLQEHAQDNSHAVLTFPLLLRLMRFLPHALALGVPLAYSPTRREILVQFISFFFLDISGGPAHRSRYYTTASDMREINLRMGLCITLLIDQCKGDDDFRWIFEKQPALGDVSIGGWLDSAMMNTWAYHWYSSNNIVSYPDEIHTTRSESLLVVMFMMIAVLRSNHQTFRPIAVNKLPSFSRTSTAKLPEPFDLNDWIQHKSPIESKSPAGFEQYLTKLQRQFIDEDEISNDAWCYYQTLTNFWNLQNTILRGRRSQVKLHATKVSKRKWNIRSDPYGDTRNSENVLSGTMEGDEKLCILSLTCSRPSSDMIEIWSGRLSPFGFLGGYRYGMGRGAAPFGGYFWLFKESWIEEAGVEE